MIYKCDGCGAESEIAEAFRKERRSFSTKEQTLCNLCRVKKRHSYFKGMLVFYLLMALAGLAIVIWSEDKKVGWLWLNCVLFEIFMILTILPHELGHAFAARWLGWRVFYVVIGMGKVMYQRKFPMFKIVFKLLPFGGLAIGTPRDCDYSRLKHWLIIFAGPFVNAVLASAALWCACVINIRHGMGGGLPSLAASFLLFNSKLIPVHLFALANLFVLAVNLFPRRITTDFGKMRSDGLALIKIPFLPQESINQLSLSYYIYEAAEAYEAKDHAKVESWCKTGLEKFPESDLLINLEGVSLLRMGKFSAARERFQKLLARPSQNPVYRPLFLNNLAFADVSAGDPALLEEADRYSKEALANLPWAPEIKSTRGTVLVELGQIEEGIRLLQEALLKNEDISSKAINACFLSVAERRRGNALKAENYLKSAISYDPDCPFIQKARGIE